MDETSEKVTKDPKGVDAACKGREKYMSKLRESILNDAEKGGGNTTNASNEITSPTNNASNETISATSTTTTPATSTNNTTTTISNDTYVYGVGILVVLAIGACVFFSYQAKNKTQVNDCRTAQHEQKQLPKRCHML